MKYWRKPLDSDKIDIPHGELHILADQCKGCGFCVEYCPKDILELSDEFNLKGYHPPVVLKEGDCVYCQLCEIICPEFAIFVTSKNGSMDSD
jgi:2-oxoglutarate ferredoxin oxidoreductase subunit delta